MKRDLGLVLLAAGSIVLSTLGSFPPSRAADPSGGTVGPPPNKPAVAWKGPTVTTSQVQAEALCGTPGSVCDEFTLTVAVPTDYWMANTGGVTIEISWGSSVNIFTFVVRREGKSEIVACGCENPPRTDQSVLVPSASGTYRVRVVYQRVVNSGYQGTGRFVSQKGVAAKPEAIFDQITPLSFGPATVVSAHFLGSEPMMVVERSVDGSIPGKTDPKRIFVDWPLSGVSKIGQVSRSVDGGESFRLLFDLKCAQRSRPTCQTGGGGDTDTEVNLYNGTLYFVDQESPIVNEAFASSTDHGDTFPPTRQFEVSNAATSTDRPWIGASDLSTIKVGGRVVEAFLTYHVPAGGLYVQGIDQDGLPIPQPVPQIPDPGLSVTGPVRVDTGPGPGRGWLYQILDLRGDVYVASAPGTSYQDVGAWRVSKVSSDDPTIFPWLALDRRGNAYATWAAAEAPPVEGAPARWAVHFSFSPIDEPQNNPTLGGRPGSFWAPQVRVSLPWIASAVFPAVVAADPGHVGIAYLGSPDFVGKPDAAPEGARWNVYAAVVGNVLLGGPPLITTGTASRRTIHTGAICTRGAQCGLPKSGPNSEGPGDRSLLDMIDVGFDDSGRLSVVWADNHNSLADFGGLQKGNPFVYFAKQVGGPSLLAGKPLLNIHIPRNAREDRRSEATWPNAPDVRYLPSLDLFGASIQISDREIVGRVPLSEASSNAMTKDLAEYNKVLTSAPAAQRIQLVIRFSSAEEIYHLSMEHLSNGIRRFFGGRLDANDRLSNGSTSTPESSSTLASGYHADSAFNVSGEVEGNTIVLRGKASDFKVSSGSRLFGVTAFAMVGPIESEEVTIFNLMRTIDSTPAFDVGPETALQIPPGQGSGRSRRDSLVPALPGPGGEMAGPVPSEARRSEREAHRPQDSGLHRLAVIAFLLWIAALGLLMFRLWFHFRPRGN